MVVQSYGRETRGGGRGVVKNTRVVGEAFGCIMCVWVWCMYGEDGVGAW